METELLNYFQSHPWATAGDASRALGLDRANVKRDSKKLARRGLLQHRINGQAYEWAVANGAANGGAVRDDQSSLEHHLYRLEPPRPAQHNRPAHAGPINGPVHVTDDQPIRLSPSQALVPAGGQVIHKMPGVPASGGRDRVQLHPGGLAAIMPGYFELDPDGSLTDLAMVRRAAAVQADNAYQAGIQTGRAMIPKPKEPSLGELGFATGMAAPNVFASMASKPALPTPEKPPSLLQQAREARAAELAEAKIRQQERFRQSVREQMERFPPDEYPGLYSHLDEADWPDEYLDVDENDAPIEDEEDMEDDTDLDDAIPREAPVTAQVERRVRAAVQKTVKQVLAEPNATVKPNGDAEPTAAEDASDEPMSGATLFALVGGAVALIALAWRYAPR